jgi:hypothetical protein
MDLTVILTGIGTAIAIIGANVALIAWLRADMKSFETEVRGWREEIHQEMKDFHGRMERQDAEFKAHMMYLHGDKSSVKPQA